MNDSIRFERLWTRAVGVFAAALFVYFVITESGGLFRLIDWFAKGIAAAPAALQNIVTHYAALTSVMLVAPLVVGALVGVVATWLAVPHVSSLFVRRMIIGAALGAVSGQIIPAAIRHCTYAAEAPVIETILGVILTGLSALILLIPAWSLMHRRGGSGTSGFFRHGSAAYLFLAPTLLSLVLFLYYPSVQMVSLSLNLRRASLPQERFVCLRNYTSLVSDPIYQNSLITTLAITIGIVLISLAIALGIAVLASQKIRFISVYRAVLIFPFALSPVVTGAVFLGLFREGTSGVISYALISAFGSAPQWLRDPAVARWLIVGASVWNILGFNILFYIAGLQNVPKDLLEAAHIDGAHARQRFRHVTFPLLSPYTFFLLITNVTYSFYGIYGVVDSLTSGGPPLGPAGIYGGATDVLIFKLYQDAFTPGAPLGLASAQAVMLFVFVAALTLLQFRTVESRVHYGE